ncbi:M28 family metallopeptidase [Solilutibacter silvestris]|uniref:Putative aminopeptidase n=1 Tax=Solilutibacter silvestris TaxID=1645665 RepID=A0A2K1Q1S7_9GAMM|nr:M28 family metallopeptidase [Lysobacter silvestris]PNS08983.1 putative aminopeptidase [Lysobacter silvestris]
MRRSLLTVALCAATAIPAFAGGPKDTPTFDPKSISNDIRVLSSDAFEGRGPATAGETKTVNWLITQLQAAGLKPGGTMKNGKRGWTQPVPLLRAAIEGTPHVSVAADGKTIALAQGEQIAVRAALDGAKSVDIRNAPLVFVGYGVKAPERRWDDYKGVDLHGKIMVVLVNDPDFETGQGDFGGKAMTYYGRWTYKYEEGARQGAAGVLVVHETAPASYGWATVKNSNTNTMFDVVRDHPAAVHPRLEGWIQRDVAVDLLKRAGLDFNALKKQAQTRDFKPVELKGERFSAKYAVDSKVITSQNVIGVVPGRKHPGEMVMYSAHWDHLGIGQPDAKGDRIYNGAVDNASGVAGVMALARAFAKAKPAPDRSLGFLFVTAEEKGLLGSEYYASKPVYPLGKTVGVINIDGMNMYGPSRDFSISGSAKLDLLDDLIATAKQWNLSYSPDSRPEAGSFFRSDHFSFAKRGVPAVSFESGDDMIDGGLAAGRKLSEDYTRDRYHQPADQWEASWTITGAARDLQVVYALGWQLANSREWPNWSQDSEFRTTRDQSAKDRK